VGPTLSSWPEFEPVPTHWLRRRSDNGVGGADPAGHGLRGLADRVEAAAGTLTVDSPVGSGTTITAELPCES
jgi:glucose-6-phosphate-specific signal transduction histidine kinase